MKNLKRRLINFCCNTFIQNNDLRNSLKSRLFTKVSKFGASYSVWDGEELLEFSIKSIRSQVDYINVVWQKLSWYGNPCDDNLENLLLRLKSDGLIDEIIFFEPDFKLTPTQNETNKRNLGLRAAQKVGCKHFLTMDTDEFFDEKELEWAKTHILANNITHSACNQFLYEDVNHRQINPADFFPPFIYRIDKGEKFKNGCYGFSPWLVDLTKQIPVKRNSRICFLHGISLHHFYKTRKNLLRKFENSSVNLTSEQIKQYTDSTPETIYVENKFNIELD